MSRDSVAVTRSYSYMASSTTRRHSRDDPREEKACVGHKTVVAFGESVSVSVSMSASASCNTAINGHTTTQRRKAVNPTVDPTRPRPGRTTNKRTHVRCVAVVCRRRPPPARRCAAEDSRRRWRSSPLRRWRCSCSASSRACPVSCSAAAAVRRSYTQQQPQCIRRCQTSPTPPPPPFQMHPDYLLQS